MMFCKFWFFFFMLCFGAWANDCQELLSYDRELTLDQRFQAYVLDLLQEGVLGTAELKTYRKSLKKGVVANPVTESVAVTNYEAMIHRDSLQEYVDSGELTREGQLAWVEKKLEELERQRTKRKQIGEEIRVVDMDVTSRQWWERVTERMLKYIEPREQFVGKDMKTMTNTGSGVKSSRKGMNPLHFAAEYASHDTVKKLLEIHRGKLDIHARDERGETALFRAILNPDLDVIKLLLSEGAEINAKNEYGNTPLHWASSQGNPNVVKFLLADGADIHTVNEYGELPLHWASEYGKVEVVELLLASGAEVDVKNSLGNITPLQRASWQGHTEVVELLLASGADVNAKDSYFKTPLYRASEKGHAEVVELLLAAGADVHTRDGYNNTSLHRASEKGYGKVVELLIAAGANVKTKDKRGHPPLYWASEYGNTKLVELLIAAGATEKPWWKFW